ncbi:MFS transporter [Bosea sp. Tri-44]|uniref:MFS transporter n=1 Tax=Bosea sp. Tri-44 TaxID=1972137 RepID=UPI00100F6F8C|nr:MFS transporter [Bosea sp. Tri-44]RXT56376.1 MFS transporter [Bosea sp. Tri-44]
MTDLSTRLTVRRLLVLQFVSMGAMEMSGPFWPLYLKGLAPSEQAFQIASIGAYVGPMLGIMLTSTFWGRIGDRHGNKPMMIRALLGLCATQLLIAVSNDVWVIVALRFLQGACAGYLAPAQAYGVQIESPERRAQLFAHLQIATNLGSLFGAILGGLILDRAPFPLINVTAGLLCAACAAAAWLGLPIPPAKPPQAIGPSKADKHPSGAAVPVAGLLVLLGLLLMARMLTQVPFSLYIREIYGAAPWVTGLCYGLVALGFVISASHWTRALSGKPLDAILRWLLLVIAGCALATIAIGLTRTLSVMVGLFLAWGILLGATTPVVMSVISAATSMNRQGYVLGLSQSTQQFSSVSGIFLGALLSDMAGLSSIFFFVCAFYLLSLVVAAALWRRELKCRPGLSALDTL